MKKILDNGHIMHYNNHCSAGVAHLVERDLAKVEVASSSLVARSKKKHHPNRVVFFCIYRPGRGSNRARAKREKHAGGMFWCPRACGGPAGPPASLVARSKKKHHPNRMVFFCIYRAAGDVLTVMQAAQKRRISTTLLSFSEDGARERYSIICYTFSFSLQPLCQWLHRR